MIFSIVHLRCHIENPSIVDTSLTRGQIIIWGQGKIEALGEKLTELSLLAHVLTVFRLNGPLSSFDPIMCDFKISSHVDTRQG